MHKYVLFLFSTIVLSQFEAVYSRSVINIDNNSLGEPIELQSSESISNQKKVEQTEYIQNLLSSYLNPKKIQEEREKQEEERRKMIHLNERSVFPEISQSKIDEVHDIMEKMERYKFIEPVTLNYNSIKDYQTYTYENKTNNFLTSRVMFKLYVYAAIFLVLAIIKCISCICCRNSEKGNLSYCNNKTIFLVNYQ